VQITSWIADINPDILYIFHVLWNP
jgi:hypothetical protein